MGDSIINSFSNQERYCYVPRFTLTSWAATIRDWFNFWCKSYFNPIPVEGGSICPTAPYISQNLNFTFVIWQLVTGKVLLFKRGLFCNFMDQVSSNLVWIRIFTAKTIPFDGSFQCFKFTNMDQIVWSILVILFLKDHMFHKNGSQFMIHTYEVVYCKKLYCNSGS